MDHLGLEQAVDGFGKSIVVGITDAADRGFDACLGEPFRVAKREVLPPAIRVVDEPAALDGTALMQGLLQGIEHKAGVSGPGDPPADDAARKGVNDEGDVDKSRPSRDVGEVADPQGVRARCFELAVDPVERAGGSRVGDRGADRPAPIPSRASWRQTFRAP